MTSKALPFPGAKGAQFLTHPAATFHTKGSQESRGPRSALTGALKENSKCQAGHSTRCLSPAPTSLFGLVPRKRLTPRPVLGDRPPRGWLVLSAVSLGVAAVCCRGNTLCKACRIEADCTVRFTGLFMRAVCGIPHALSKTWGILFLSQENRNANNSIQMQLS